MKSILKRNRVLAVIALIGLLASLVPLISRVQAEESNKYYDIVLDYNSMRSMARQSSQSEDEWIDLFKSLGVDKVALSEASALNLHDNAAIPVHAMTVKKAAESYGWEDQYPAEVAQWLRESTDVSDAIIWTETAASYEWILNAFEARFEDFEAKTYLEGEHGFIFIQQQKNGMKGEKLLDLRLGIWPDTVELFERHGYQIIPRSVTEKNMNGTKFAEAYIEVLKHFNAPYFMNNGDELVGYEDDESLELLTQYLNESGASVAMMEQNDQSQNLVWPGVEELLDNTGYRGVRVFNEWAYIQNRYQYCGYEGPEEITNTFFRAIAERNCKIIFLKMILEPDTDVSWDADEKEWVYITAPADYEQMLTDLDARLEPLGYTHATVPAMELKAPSMALKVLQGIGTAALIVILLDLFFFIGKRWRTILFAVGARPCRPRGAETLDVPPDPLDVRRYRDAVDCRCRSVPRTARKETKRAADQVRQAPRLYDRHSHRDHSDGILWVAARVVRALAALVYPRDRPVPRRQAHAAHPHRTFHARLSSGLRL